MGGGSSAVLDEGPVGPRPPEQRKHKNAQPTVVFQFLDAVTQHQYFYNAVTGESSYVDTQQARKVWFAMWYTPQL
jgi:hypothetical protein